LGALRWLITAITPGKRMTGAASMRIIRPRPTVLLTMAAWAWSGWLNSAA
jgi:hypothetical protein